MPLENVTIKLNAQTTVTNKNGTAYLENIPQNYYNDESIEFFTTNDTLQVTKRQLF